MKATKSVIPSKNKSFLADKRANQAANWSDVLKCRLCEFENPASLLSHIRHKHEMSVSDYRAAYPEDVLQRNSSRQNERNSEANKKRLEDPATKAAFLEWRSFPSEVKHWIRKGYDPKEAQQKVAEFQSVQAKKAQTLEHLEKMRQRTAGDLNPMSLTSLFARHGVSVEEASKLTPCFGRMGEKHPMFGKKHTEEAIKKIGQHINHSGRSKIEHEMSNILISEYGGTKNSHAAGWCCDYVCADKKLIVEFFGDFWHHNPFYFDENWTILSQNVLMNL